MLTRVSVPAQPIANGIVTPSPKAQGRVLAIYLPLPIRDYKSCHFTIMCTQSPSSFNFETATGLILVSYTQAHPVRFYSMIFLECNIRNLHISASEHHSKVQIAPLDRARKTIFSIFSLISWSNMTYLNQQASKSNDIYNISKSAV